MDLDGTGTRQSPALPRSWKRSRRIQEAAKDYILSGLPKALSPISQTAFPLRLSLRLPTQILRPIPARSVCGLEVEDTKLVPSNGDTKARGLGTAV